MHDTVPVFADFLRLSQAVILLLFAVVIVLFLTFSVSVANPKNNFTP